MGTIAGMVEKQADAKSARLLYLPPAIVRLALGATVKKVDGEVVFQLAGEDPLAMSIEDYEIAVPIAVTLRRQLPRPVAIGNVIDAVGQAHRMLSEAIFQKDAVRVLYFPIHAAGSLFYRCMMPTLAMNSRTRAKGFVSKNRIAREAAEYDVVVFQIGHSDQDLNLVKELQSMGKKCVFEIDDAFDALEDWHTFSDQYKRQQEFDSIVKMMETCDAVIVSTRWLAERYRRWAKRIEIIPNMIPLDDWPQVKYEDKARPFRILWAGSPSHWGDLEVVGRALTRFVADEAHPNVKLVFFGREPVGLNIPKDLIEVHDFVDFSVYPQKLADLAADVAIAPLADVPFNQGKSNVKLLEYWATGYPVVASCVGPYADTIQAGVNGVLCKTEDDWVDALAGLYGNGKLRRELARKGRETVERYNASNLVDRVENFFLSLAKG